MNSELHNKTKERSRKLAISQGAYDGRFRTKVVADKKKDLFRKLRNEKFKLNYF